MKKWVLLFSILFISYVLMIWQTSLLHAGNVQVSVTAQDKLDAFLNKVENMKNQFNNDIKYENFLDTMRTKLNGLSNKYSKNTTIIEMIKYLEDWVSKLKTEFVKNKDMNNFFCDLSDTCEPGSEKSMTGVLAQKPSTENNIAATNTGTQKKCNFDECLNNDFYVIKSTNTDYPEGCHSEWLILPEDLCILKIGKMYVAPKNYTFIEKPTNNYVTSLVKDNRVHAIKNSVIIQSTPSAWASCHDVLTQVDAKYNRFTPEWDTSKASQFFAERDYVRNNSPECKALDNASNAPDPYKGKVTLWANPQTCEALFNEILPEKKWKFIDEFGWDGGSRNCTQNNSNKNGLCALELHLAKLQLYTDKPYYVWKNILATQYGTEYQMYQSSIINDFFATYLWDWKLLKPTPIYERKINYSSDMIKGPDGNYTRPVVNGNIQWYSLAEWANGFYKICVWF